MARIGQINRERFLWCCADRGVSAEQAARDVGIAITTVERFLSEGGGLTFLQLKKFADYFGRGVLFFLDEGVPRTEAVHTVQYRTLTGQKPQLPFQIRKLIERAERQRQLYLNLREDLHHDDYPRFEHPDIGPPDAEQNSSIARKWLGLSNENTFDAYRNAVQAKGILVFRTNGYSGDWQIPKDSPILGFSLYDKVCPVIVVRKSIFDTQQVFTLMHELGHLLLHRESSIDDENDMQSQKGHEKQANDFAGKALVPERFLLEIDDSTRPAQVSDFDSWTRPLRKRLGVSTEVVLRRLLDTHRLPAHLYQAYREYLKALPLPQDSGGTRAYRHREPKHIFGEMYVRTVLDALASRRITLNKASNYLDGIKLNDIHQLEQHIAGL